MVLTTPARVVVVTWLCAGWLVLAACTASQTNPSTSATQENLALNDVLPPEVALDVRNKAQEYRFRVDQTGTIIRQEP